jgi:catechol 2,3-dioxygenase-like lactoylglutathione lyase family enzyme
MASDIDFRHTGLRVRDLDGAVAFFTEVLGMKLRARVDDTWNGGVFANLGCEGSDHYLELNWYSPDSRYCSEFVEGDQLDHLGLRVKDFEGTLKRLEDAGYPVQIGPDHDGKWHVAFVRGPEGIWLDVYRVDE